MLLRQSTCHTTIAVKNRLPFFFSDAHLAAPVLYQVDVFTITAHMARLHIPFKSGNVQLLSTFNLEYAFDSVDGFIVVPLMPYSFANATLNQIQVQPDAQAGR
jgi:hypothetical protein